MTAKARSVFAGVQLSNQTPLAKPGVDQRLFSPDPRAQPEPKQPPRPARPAPEPGKPATQETGNPAPQPGIADLAHPFDLGEPPYRKDTFLFTNEEFEALDDLKLQLRRALDMKVTKNDLARCALHHLIEDYQQHRESSAIVRMLKKRRHR